MVGRNKTKLQALAGILEIPQDIILDLPRITMLGNQQLLLENHKGIIEYTSQVVRIKLNSGEIKIQGTKLTLSNLQPEQILIEGTISHLTYDT